MSLVRNPIWKNSVLVRWLRDGAGWPSTVVGDSALVRAFLKTARQFWADSRLRIFAEQYPGRVRSLGLIVFAVLFVISSVALRIGWVFLAAAGFLSLAILRLRNPRQNQWVVRFFFIMLATRVAVTLMLYLISPRVWIETGFGPVQNGGFFVGDGYGYAFNGRWLADRWRIGLFPNNDALSLASMSKTTTPFDYWNGIVIFLLGYHPVTLFFLNGLFGAWTAVLTYWIAGFYLNEKSARCAGILVGCWPSLFLWSTQNLKEPMTILLLLLSIFFFVVPLRRWRLAVRAAGIGTSFLLQVLNPFIGPLFWISTILMYLFSRRFLRRLCLGTAVLLIFLVVTGFGKESLQKVGQQVDHILFGRPVFEIAVTPDRFAEMVEYLRQVRTWDARTPFFGHVQLNTIKKLFSFLPIGIAAILVMPFPWAARSAGEMLGSLDMLIWYPLLFFALRGSLRSMFGSYGQKIIFCSCLLICGSLAILEGNMGTLFRHRAAVWPMLLFFVAAGLETPAAGAEAGRG